MIERKYLFPGVIELNLQAGRPLGVNIYLIDGGTEWALIDVGQDDTLDEVIELIRELDFPLSKCKLLIATHADADHVQALAKARERLKAKTAAHPRRPRRLGDRRRGRDLRQHLGPELPHPDAAVQDRREARRGRRGQGRQAEAEGLAHARPHAGPAQLQARQPALQRRQHLQGRLRRRHRRPPRLAPPELHPVARRASATTTPSSCCPATARFSARTRRFSKRPSTG